MNKLLVRLSVILALVVPLLMPSVSSAGGRMSSADKQLIQEVRRSVNTQTQKDLSALKEALKSGKISKQEYKAQAKQIQASQNSLLATLNKQSNQPAIASALGKIKADPGSASQVSAMNSGFKQILTFQITYWGLKPVIASPS